MKQFVPAMKGRVEGAQEEEMVIGYLPGAATTRFTSITPILRIPMLHGHPESEKKFTDLLGWQAWI